MAREKQPKEKKEKIRYIDDGRSLADMSGVGRKGQKADKSRSPRQAPGMRDVMQTYFDAVRMMLLPCAIAIGVIAVAFLILWLLAR